MPTPSYLPPSLRATQKKELPVNLEGLNFPSLSTAAPVQVKFHAGFKQTILNLIEKEQLDEIERNREPELDPKKMTLAQLEKAGWTVLRVDRAAAMAVAARMV